MSILIHIAINIALLIIAYAHYGLPMVIITACVLFQVSEVRYWLRKHYEVDTEFVAAVAESMENQSQFNIYSQQFNKDCMEFAEKARDIIKYNNLKIPTPTEQNETEKTNSGTNTRA